MKGDHFLGSRSILGSCTFFSFIFILLADWLTVSLAEKNVLFCVLKKLLSRGFF